ncbi:hypothetical protein C8Q80DRAFT_754377 [Daedaleopsis nitida]|nr:hypothetical protein C8Q80DRAFT_754377 [Daedaleopsis nitida]
MPANVTITLSHDIHGNQSTQPVHLASVNQIEGHLVGGYFDRDLHRVARLTVRDTSARSCHAIRKELATISSMSGLIELRFAASGLMFGDLNANDTAAAFENKPHLRDVHLTGLPISLQWPIFTQLRTIVLRDCFTNWPRMTPRALCDCIAQWASAKVQHLEISSLSPIVDFSPAARPAAPPADRKSLPTLRHLVLEDTCFRLRSMLEHLTISVAPTSVKLVTKCQGESSDQYYLDVVQQMFPRGGTPLGFLSWKPIEVMVAASEDKVTITAFGPKYPEQKLVVVAFADHKYPGSCSILFCGALRSLAAIVSSEVKTLIISGPLCAMDTPAAWSKTLGKLVNLTSFRAVDTERKWTAAPLQAALDASASDLQPLLCKDLRYLSLRGVAYTAPAVQHQLSAFGPLMKRRVEQRGAAKLRKLDLEVVLELRGDGCCAGKLRQVQCLENALYIEGVARVVDVRPIFSGPA